MNDTDIFIFSLRGDVQGLQRHLEQGGDPHVLLDDETPLFHMTNTDCAHLLIDAGVDIDHQNADGMTALHVAILAGHQTIFQLLLQAGANVTLCSTNGLDAKRYIQQFQKQRRIEYLTLLEREIIRRATKRTSSGQEGGLGL